MVSGPGFAALSLTGSLFMCEISSAMFGDTILYLCHGIVVGAVDRRQFYERVADTQKGGLMWQKITIFGQCENTAYFDCQPEFEVSVKVAIEASAKWRE